MIDKLVVKEEIKTVKEYTLTGKAILELAKIALKLDTPQEYEVTVEVPRGGDYSGEILKIGEDTDVKLKLTYVVKR